MEFNYYKKLFKENILLILIITLIGVIIFICYYSFMDKPYYESKTTFWITKFKKESWNDARIKLINDIKQLAKSNDFINSAKIDLSVEIPGFEEIDNKSLSEMIIFEFDDINKVFSVGFRGRDPDTTAYAAKLVAKRFQLEIARFYEIQNIVVVDDSNTPELVPFNIEQRIILTITIPFFVAVAFVLYHDIRKPKKGKYIEKQIDSNITGM